MDYVYIVTYNRKPLVFRRYKDAIKFINSKRNGELIYTDETFNGKKYTYLPIKVKVK